jgi:membrane protease YdiL (CAAX protease family)
MNEPTTNPYRSPETFAPQAPFAVAQPAGTYWGPWATLGWTVVAIIVMTIVQFAVGIHYVVGVMLLDQHADLSSLARNGNFVSTLTIANSAAITALVVLLCRVRQVPISDYLAIRRPTFRQIAVWLIGLAVFIVATDLTSYAMSRPISEWMAEVYATGWLPLLLVMVLIAAPVWEETLMRGFVFTGIARSSWGVGCAIFLSSLIWALLHVQYGWFEIVTIFVLGIYLGAARHFTGSLPLTMLLHSAVGAVATVEMIIAGSGA